ncbi:MAG: hypothetical protein ACLP9K_05820 [Nitrososphaerales archaeon]
MALLSVLLGLAVAYVFIVALVAVLWYDLARRRKSEEVELLEQIREAMGAERRDLDKLIELDYRILNNEYNILRELDQLLSAGKKPRTITLTAEPAQQ